MPLCRVGRDGARGQRLDRHELERPLVRRAEYDVRRPTRLVRLEPTRRAEAPAVARLQTGEAPLGTRRREVVADRAAELEELPRSSGPVEQQPSRKNPVSGSVEQGSSSPPTTLTSGSRVTRGGYRL